MKIKIAMTAALAALLNPSVHAFEVDHQLSVQGRTFIEEAQFPEQVDDQWSVAYQPEMVWDADSQRFTFTPFFRHDFADDERTHHDIREALWMTWESDWELRAGIGKVFWGVTESLHLVDVINQTDFVESLDGEEKLGFSVANANKDLGYFLALCEELGTTSLIAEGTSKSLQAAVDKGLGQNDVPVIFDYFADLEA